MPRDPQRESIGGESLSSETLLDAVGDVVYAVGTDGRLLQWNDRLPALTGLTDDELASLSWGDLLLPADVSRVADHVSWLYETGETTYTADFLTRDGGAVRFECRERRLTDGETTVGRCGVARRVEPATRPIIRQNQFESLVKEITDYAIFLLDPSGHVVTWNDGARRLKGYREEEITGQHFSVFYTDRDIENEVPNRILSAAAANGRAEDRGWRVKKSGSRFWADVVVSAIHDETGALVGFTKVTHDITDRWERETTLRRRRDELDTLNRINVLIQDLIQELTEKPSRESIEQSVCDGLADSEFYQFAWIAEPDVDGRTVNLRASAGDDGGAREAITTVAMENGIPHPSATAFHTGETLVAQNIAENTDIPEPFRTAAAQYGIRAAIAVPIRFVDAVYGTLVVYANDPDAFSPRERAAFEVLCCVVGLAVNAARNRHLLFADSLVELEFRVTDPTSAFVALSDRLECRFDLIGQAVSLDDHLIQYIRVEGAPPDEVVDCLRSFDEIRECRLVVDEGDNNGLIEVANTVSGLKSLLESGASVRSASAENGVATVVAEIAKGEDVRSIVHAFRSVYPDSTLVGKRDVDRPVRTLADFRRRLGDRLTPRQQTALRTAFYAGYFEWPRESTAEDVADTMGISSATLHYHLRRAQLELIGVFLDETQT